MSTRPEDTHTQSSTPPRTGIASSGGSLSRAERRYEWIQESSKKSLPSWRTPARRRLLVRLNWACIAIMSAIAVAGYFWLPIILAWLPMTVAIIASWTMLRVTIDSKDTAPAHYLDEFEAATLLNARSSALSVVSSILFVMALVLIFTSTLELGDGHRLAYTAGAIAILTFFVAAIIPAAAMAGTMDPDADDR